MNYKLIYNSIITNTKQLATDRILQKKNKTGYFEKHHIIPKCLNGSNDLDNLVLLTAKEHFICHRLLCEIYPDNDKLKYALNKMLQYNTDQPRYVISSRIYSNIKLCISNIRKGKSFEEIFGIDKAIEIRTRLKLNSYSKGKSWKTRLSEKSQKSTISKISNTLSGSNNERYGKTWEDYYGIEKANTIKQKASNRQLGNKNHMFGKKLSDDVISKRTATRQMKKRLDPNYANKNKGNVR